MTNKKNILSIDYDDDNESYDGFLEHLKKDEKRKKQFFASVIDDDGLVKELDKKKRKRNIKKRKLVEYIISKSDEYDYDELMSFSFADVVEIHNEVKTQNQNPIVKFIKFLFNY